MGEPLGHVLCVQHLTKHRLPEACVVAVLECLYQGQCGYLLMIDNMRLWDSSSQGLSLKSSYVMLVFNEQWLVMAQHIK